MSNPQVDNEERSVTRAKLVLVGALGLVLVGVIYFQFFAGDESDTATGRSVTSSSRKAPRVQKQTADKQTEEKLSYEDIATEKSPLELMGKAWVPVSLETAISYDPFALPASFPEYLASNQVETGGPAKDQLDANLAAASQAQVAEAQKLFEELKKQGVQVVIRKGDHYFAMIDNKLIQVGDEVKGFTVIRIDDNGIEVAKELP